MILSAAVAVLGADTVVAAADESAELTGCFAADLMSDVLAFAREGCLLITGLATHQVIWTTALKHLPAVVIVEGKQADGEMVETAREEAIGVYRTELSKYEACGLLMQSGLRPGSTSASRPQQ